METSLIWLLGYSSFILLFLTFCSGAETRDILIPNYESIQYKLNTFKIKSALVLSCQIVNVDNAKDLVLTWEKYGEDVTTIKNLTNRYKIIDKENKFIIHHAEESDAGNYSCVLTYNKNRYSKDFVVYAHLAVKVPGYVSIVEGEKIEIPCTVLGTNASVQWTITEEGGKEIDYNKSYHRFFLQPNENNLENATLVIENATLEDRGTYKCMASNLASTWDKPEPKQGYVVDMCVVRVQGKLAALWPFLGICAEVFVLCAIILIYEKRRNKTELDESDTDPNTESKKKRRNYD